MNRRLWTAVGVVLSSLGLTCELFALTFLRLSPLSASFQQRAITSAALGGVLFAAGTALALLPFLRRGRAHRRPIFHGVALPPLLAWCLFCGAFYLLQDRLLFNPRDLSGVRYTAVARDYPAAEEVHIEVGTDVLHGWLLPPSTGVKPAPLILLFYGQGGEASRYFRLAEKVPEAAWAFIHYRGYGWSTGSPSEKGLFADSLAVYDRFAAHPAIDTERIVALAGSLGTGIATYLSAHRPLAAVVLFSPYDSIAGGVARDLIPLLPTTLLMRNQFDVRKYAQKAKAPALAIVGEADAVIQMQRSQVLLEHWAQAREMVVIPGGTHYSIYEEDISWEAVREFLAKLDII